MTDDEIWKSDALMALNAELGLPMDRFGALVRSIRASLAAPAGAGVEEFPLPEIVRGVAERLHTQDNRITDNPLFAVQQKRRIYGLDSDYASNYEWALDGESITVKEGEKPPKGARRVYYIDIWEFVTGCFTEQGCKDFIAVNGHNLHEPRIYAYGSFRNAEFIGLRKWLMGLGLQARTEGSGT